MSINRIQVWTCDRCKNDETMASERQPEGWIGVGWASPPSAAFEDSSRSHLCKQCAAELGSFLLPEADN